MNNVFDVIYNDYESSFSGYNKANRKHYAMTAKIEALRTLLKSLDDKYEKSLVRKEISKAKRTLKYWNYKLSCQW
jgi:hypothetical protein